MKDSNAAVLDRPAVRTTSVVVLDRPDLTRTYGPEDVAQMRAQFRELKAAGYFAYREDGQGGSSGTVIKEFDETADAVVYVPRMVGG